MGTKEICEDLKKLNSETDEAQAKSGRTVVMPTPRNKTVIFDLDGTLALIEHRRYLVAGKNQNWDEFYLACANDEPNKPVIDLCNMLYEAGYTIRILSGRGNIAFAKTLGWLINNGVKYNSIWMRDREDYTPDEELKRKWLNEIRNSYGEEIILVFDDRDKVVEMWREEGLICLQVAKGSF